MNKLSKEQMSEQTLSRGVEGILPSRAGLSSLMKKRKIRLYLGIDPTSPKLHLGHTIPLRKLQQFQELGHEAILLFGTFTTQIGDPSGRDEKRKPLTPAQIKKNMATYKKQAAKVLDISRVKIKGNADWLAKMNFADVLELASHITVPRLWERDMFQQRLKKGGDVWTNEFLYPLMQGYDSVAMDVDLEIGARDQLFNMLIGRKLQKIYHKKEKFVLTTPLLMGLDGRKMSKTYANTVNLDDSPNEMFGKLMSLKDSLIPDYFKLCTDIPLSEITKITRQLSSSKVNPRDIKAQLAREIVSLYHTKRQALYAEKEFDRVFKEKKSPTNIKQVSIKQKSIGILDLLVKLGFVSSKAEAKRLVMQGGARINGKTISDWQKKIIAKPGTIIQAGKRRFVKIN